MQNVPKLVRARLQRPMPVTAEAHPDADLLTAFAEQSLAGHERDHVLQHLAHCGDCREVVALALPATEAVTAVRSESAARSGWFSLPVLRWGVVAAGILAVGSIGILELRQHSHEKILVSSRLTPRDQLAPLTTETPPSPQTSASATIPPPAETNKQTERSKKAAAHGQSRLDTDKSVSSANAVFPSQPAGRAYSTGASRGAAVGTASRSPVYGFNSTPHHDWALQQPTPPAAAKQSPVPGPASQTVEVTGAAPTAEVQSEAAEVTTNAAQSSTRDQVAQNELAGKLTSQREAVVRAKPTSPQAPPSSMAAAPLLRSDPSLMKSPALPRWTISSNGALQRSLDGGKTWLDVNLAGDDSLSSNLVSRSQSEMTLESQSGTKNKKEMARKDKNKETKAYAKAQARSDAPSAMKSADTEPASSTSTIFRALSVSANAADVWAGGSGGTLFHTMDGGNLWVRVIPSVAGIVLTGDIVSIQFPDPRTGTVTTSNAEVWATNDDGQSWRKQQ